VKVWTWLTLLKYVRVTISSAQRYCSDELTILLLMNLNADWFKAWWIEWTYPHMQSCGWRHYLDWILKSERIRKQILRFFTKQINPRSLASCCIKGTEKSTLGMDSLVPLTLHDPSDLGIIYLIKKNKISFRILSDLRIQSWIFLKETHPIVFRLN